MKKTASNLIGLNMIFVVSLVISNVVTAKLFATGLNLFGSPLNLPGAALCYAITFLMTDVVGEIYGKKEANRTVRWGFVGQMVASILILTTQYLPTSDETVQQAYNTLLGQNWVFVIGSLSAYFASQTWDVWVFHKIRNRFSADPKKRWIWNNASTMTSQIIDTVVFIGISFGIGFGWLFDSAMRKPLLAMMIGQYCLKFILAALDTPFFYLMTRKSKKSDSSEL